MRKILKNTNPIYAITDYNDLNQVQVLNRTRQLFDAGINILQYRNKQASLNENLEYSNSLKQLCKEYNAIFLINDNLELTKQLDADGLHIGKDDVDLEYARRTLPDKLIGVSCYNDIERAKYAEQCSADYIAFGSFFPTQSKTNTVQASPDLITQAKSSLKIPVVAIGGITPDNGKQLVSAGADYLAAISGLYQDIDPYSKAVQYLNLYQK